jgi:Domain of unknown function (DUF5606)
MKFQELVSISGMQGLFQLIATKSDGAIVRSIDDNVTKFVAARAHSVTALDGIEVFTTSDNMRLFEVFMTMKSNQEAAGEFDMVKADNNAIKAHVGKLFPQYDADRVYISDMKKMIKWFTILDAKGMLVAPTAEEAIAPIEEVAAPTAEAAAPTAEAEVPKAKKAKAPKEETTDAEPKPKKTTKKKTEEKSAE